MIIFDSERELEDMLCELLDEGCWIVEDEECNYYLRQPSLSFYGTPDLMLYSQDLYIEEGKEDRILGEYLKLVELKITELSHKHLSQVARYKRYFDSVDHDFQMEYVLVCKKSKEYSGDLIFLAQDIGWLTIYTYELCLKRGIVFEELPTFSVKGDLEKLNEHAGELAFVVREIAKNG